MHTLVREDEEDAWSQVAVLAVRVKAEVRLPPVYRDWRVLPDPVTGLESVDGIYAVSGSFSVPSRRSRSSTVRQSSFFSAFSCSTL